MRGVPAPVAPTRPHPMATIRHSLLQAGLVLALLVTQQSAFSHAVSHLAGQSAPAQDQKLPDSKVCDKCVLSAQLPDALHAEATALYVEAPDYVRGTAQAHAFAPRSTPCFRSRAPPHLL